jgi:hypothetical protein
MCYPSPPFLLSRVWDADQALPVVTKRSWDGGKKKVKPISKNLTPGTWEIFVDEHSKTKLDVRQDEDVGLKVEVGGADVDVVAQRSA